jgi:hypothetical protein
MDPYVSEYYRKPSEGLPNGHFHEVIPLHEEKGWQWKELNEKAPDLPRGWFELAQLSSQDRVEFVKDYWLTKLPFNPRLEPFLENFFKGLDDIGIFVVQPKFDDPFCAHMIYSLKKGTGFFRGFSPADENQILKLKQAFSGIIFPEDYLAFLQIHNGFSKTTDQTGIFSANTMRASYERFQLFVEGRDTELCSGKTPIDPKDLIPFYESFGMPFFQCFWTEWYPEEEMGNVYYSSSMNAISCLAPNDASVENMSFATFSDWLMFYLETIDA